MIDIIKSSDFESPDAEFTLDIELEKEITCSFTIFLNVMDLSRVEGFIREELDCHIN